MDRNPYYVTTPIYYVNDVPHIGHAYTTVLADVLARYSRMAGRPTWFLTGTDEHGQKVRQAAVKAGVTPQEQADRTVIRFRELWRTLDITNDDFIRTTEPRHKQVVQGLLQDLYDRGEIYRAEYDGWYCVGCERFYMEKDLTDGKCPEPGCGGRPVEAVKEANYFFRMGKYQDWLIGHIRDNPTFIQPDFRRNETLGFLRNKLNDLCISRPKSRMDWGIELPFDRDFVTYVWFDALVNYISAVGCRSDTERFARWWPASCQLIGKDILTTHTVYWPTMLKAMGIPMPKMVFAHGWWLSGQDKMSKTKGNVVNPVDFAGRFGADAFRYFLMAEMSLGQDASFTEEAFRARYNADLANDLGNLLSRLTKLTETGFAGRVPEGCTLGEEESALVRRACEAAREMLESADRMRIDAGLAGLIHAVREVNRYLERTQPWTLAKTGQKEALGRVLVCSLECLGRISGALLPVMPGKMAEVRRALGLPAGIAADSLTSPTPMLSPGAPIAGSVILFPRIREEDKPAAEAPPPAVVPPAPADGVAPVEYADFEKVKLRTARILVAERVQGADKLLRLEVEAGGERRQIVAGIAQHYAPESLVGRAIVIVANLKPARIRGIESNGMLLAASAAGVLRLVTVDGDLPSGAAVK
jgi:methionyl-tRNA synthetase